MGPKSRPRKLGVIILPPAKQMAVKAASLARWRWFPSSEATKALSRSVDMYTPSSGLWSAAAPLDCKRRQNASLVELRVGLAGIM